MLFGFEGYRPIFDESEFNDEQYRIEKKPYPKPDKLQKSTATIITSFDQKINTDLLYEFLDVKDCEVQPISFFNQITIIITVTSDDGIKRKINTKIFQNGTVHMTGGQSVSDAKKALFVFVEGMKKLKIKVVINASKEEIEKYNAPEFIYCANNTDIDIDNLEYRSRMKNRHFLTNFSFCSGSLYRVLQEEKLNAHYKPDSFPGIVLKVQIKGESVNYMIFNSGKVTISISNTDQPIIQDAYKYINSLLEKHYDRIVKYTYELNIE
jgi:TATA-box binding protein (TBP) (component of TFIID and TFIIIB)